MPSIHQEVRAPAGETPRRAARLAAGGLALAMFAGVAADVRGAADSPTNQPLRKGILVQPVSRSAPLGNSGLFVGVNNFTKDRTLQALRYAVNDAVAQAYVFAVELKLIAPSNCYLALSGDPATDTVRANLAELERLGAQRVDATKPDLLEALERVTAAAQDPQDLVVISLSSHGFEDAGVPYIMPADGKRGFLADTALRLPTVEEHLQKSKANKRLLLVDACRENVTQGSKGLGQGMGTAFRDALAKSEGQAVIASCDAGQLSVERPEMGHGAFTYYLLKGLRGEAEPDERGFITLGKTSDYVAREVTRSLRQQATGTESGRVQRPWFKGPETIRQMPLAVSGETLTTWSNLVARKAVALDVLDAARKQFRADLTAAVVDELETGLGQMEKQRAQEPYRKVLDSLETLRQPTAASVQMFVSWWKRDGRALVAAESPPSAETGTSLTVAPPANPQITAPAPRPPPAPSGDLDKIATLIKDRDFEGALRLLEPLTAAPSPPARALLLQAQARLETGQFERALKDADEAARLDPALGEAFLLKAETCFELETLDDGLAACERAVACKAVETPALAMRALTRVLLAESTEMPSAAAQDLEKARRADPDDVWVAVAQGYAALAGDRVDEMQQAARQALRRDPQHPLALTLLAYSQLRLGDRDESLATAEKALRLHPKRSTVLANCASIYMNHQDFNTALSLIRRGLELNSRSFTFYRTRGFCRINSREYALALEDAEHAVQNDPRRAAGYSLRAAVYTMMGNPLKAREDADRAIQINPGFWEAYKVRAFMWFQTGNGLQAQNDVNRVLQMRKDSECYVLRAQISGLNGNNVAALADLNTAIALEPRNAAAYFQRHLLKEAAGDFLGGEQDYNKAVSLNPAFRQMER